MATVSIDEAQANLPELIENLSPGDELVITRGDKPFGVLVAIAQPSQRHLGSMRGSVTSVANDFDAPLSDFEGHMK